jgi:hypothetical protein
MVTAIMPSVRGDGGLQNQLWVEFHPVAPLDAVRASSVKAQLEFAHRQGYADTASRGVLLFRQIPISI